MPTMLIIRPQVRAQLDVETCLKAGWQAQVLSPVEIVPDVEALNTLADLYRRADVVFWVSPTAVETAAPYTDFSDGLKVHVAVGRASGKALQQCGAKRVLTPETGNDSEAVLQLPLWDSLPYGARVLIVRGRGGRDFLADALAQRGFRIEVAEIYARVPCLPDWHAAEILSADAAFVASGELVRALFAQMPPQFSRFFQSLLYFTHHPRIAEALRQAGAHNIEIAASLDAALSHYSHKERNGGRH